MFAQGLSSALVGVSAVVKRGLGDILVIGGCCAAVWGVHLLSVPAAWIAGGVLAIVLGIIGTR